MLIIVLRVAACGSFVIARPRLMRSSARSSRLDQAIGAKRLLGIVMMEIRFTAGGGNPDGGEGSGAATRLRDRELLDRGPEALANQRDRRQGDQTIVVVVRPTEDRACH